MERVLETLKVIALIVCCFGLFCYSMAINPKEQKIANSVCRAKLVSKPARVEQIGQLYQADFQITDSETLTAIIVADGNVNTMNPMHWKIGDEVTVTSISGKGHQHQPTMTYVIIGRCSTSE